MDKTRAILLALLIFGSIAFGVYQYYVSYQYDKTIGSHLDNAYEVNTPERMIVELQLAKQGMINSGLTEDNYGALIFKKPSNSMAFQYNFLDSIIERAQAVQIWYNNVYNTNGSTQESLGDVYEQKMDNLREFILENGRSDWIANDAWYVKNHIVLYLFGALYWFFLIFALTIILAWEPIKGIYSGLFNKQREEDNDRGYY